MNKGSSAFGFLTLRMCSSMILILLLLFTTLEAWAAWPGVDENLPVCTYAGEQWSPLIVSDNRDGCIMVWWDTRNGWEQINVYGQRVNAQGDVLWTPSGLQLTTAPSYSYVSYLVMCGDNDGGAFFAWEDPRNGDFDVYVQHIDSMGTALWVDNGILVSMDTKDDYVMDMAADGRGGCVVSWNVTGAAQFIGAQRLDAMGTKLWGSTGVMVSTGTSLASRAQIVSDGYGGVVACWLDGRYHPGWNEFKDIYAQRVDSSGTVCWADTSVAVLSLGSVPFYAFPELVSSGLGRFFISWYDSRSSSFDIYAQCASLDGQVLWVQDGAPVSLRTLDQVDPRIAPDDSNGIFCAWRDNYSSIYAQRLDPAGTALWQTGGVVVGSSAEEMAFGTVMHSNSGLFVVVYSEKVPSTTNYLVRTQALDASGGLVWSPAGEPISTVLSGKSDVSAISDTSSGIIAAWQDERNPSTAPDIYAQKIVMLSPVEIDFSNTPTTVYRGQPVRWQYQLTNNTDTTVAFDWWLAITGPVTRNFYLGAKTLGPQGTESGTLRLRIPRRAPLGLYTVCGCVGNWSTLTVWDRTCFESEVVQSSRDGEKGGR